MTTSRQLRHAAKHLIRACQADGLLDEGRVRAVVEELVEKQPRGYLTILKEFHRLVKLALDRRAARVESATELDEAGQASFRQNLESLYGPHLNFQFLRNPDLIAGVRIRVGSDVYDGSLRGRLDRVAEAF